MPIKRAQEESINSRSSIAREELRKLVIERLGEVDIKRSTLIKTLKLDVDETEKQWLRFKLETQENLSSGSSEAYAAYHRGYAERALTGVDDQLIYNFYSFMAYKRFKNIDIDTQKAQADLRYPTEWYPATREVQRKIILHVGPTNSGKTYNALKRLEEAETGVYAGPLRLLAHEVYTRMNAKGKPCHLITGEERRPPTSDNEENGLLNACTVEMIPLNTRLDVAVIDEIQLMGSSDRGWAWTQAFLGVRAKEVHLCGEARTVPLIRELAAAMGDEVEVHNYERLSPLKVADKSLNGNLQELRKGDCVVCFTIVDIHALRRDIEKATGKKVAIVYGSLPPETRAEQARLFNDPDNDYDILVASDAIGMGLNLAIKRIIFETVWKYNGYEKVTLSTADLKQIAGRAGRYRTAHDANKAAESSRNSSGELAPNTETTAIPAPSTPPPAPADETVGIVTAFEKEDFEVVRRAMASEPEPLKSAGIYPPDSITERFARYFPPNTPFSYILLRLHEFSSVNKRFHLCGLKDQLQVAELMEGLTLTVADKIIFCASPANVKTNVGKLLVRELARRVSEQRTGAVTDIELLSLDLLDQPTKADRLSLYHLENLHKGLSLYLWLSYRFKGIFTTRALAFHAKELTEKKIGDALKAYSATRQIRRIALQQEKKEMLANKKKEALWAREGVEGEGVGRYEPDDVLVDEVDGEALTAQE
ncbi:P-loop containing nucleoside triphosphate hydrolase protein, partial [Saccharata proteae CBS 121410]